MSETQFQIKLIPESGNFPNNKKLPLILYNSAITAGDRTDDLAREFETLFTRNDWPSAWRNGVYPYHHYHSVAHEALGVYSGRAEVQFGGDGGPVFEVRPGDIVVIPAGIAHKLISYQGMLGIVGAYPRGQSPDMQYGNDGERPGSDGRIEATPLPELDPVLGNEGPVVDAWE